MNFRVVFTAVFAVLVLAAGPLARADKPAAKAKGGTEYSHSDREAGLQVYFTEDRIAGARQYYSEHPGAGGCPPGLAKKNNGCQPPGQAKKWHRGEPLPAGVVYDEIPGELVVVLGGVPSGSKVVRVDEDLLLISIATGMVLDALEIR